MKRKRDGEGKLLVAGIFDMNGSARLEILWRNNRFKSTEGKKHVPSLPAGGICTCCAVGRSFSDCI